MKTFIMRCALALIMCSSSVAAMADVMNIFSENFSSFGSVAQTTTSYEGWELNLCIADNGNIPGNVAIKIKGYATTPAITQLSGEGTLRFKYAATKKNVENLYLRVTIVGSGSFNASDNTVRSVDYAVESNVLTEETITIYGGASDTKIKFVSDNSNFVYIDDVVVSAEGTYAPTFDLDEGYYKTSQTLRMECETAGATIYYTEDGSTPTDESTVYSAPITVSTTKTIKAVAYKGGVASAVTTAQYYVFDYIYANGFYSDENGYHRLSASESFTVSNQDLGSTRSAILRFRVKGTTASCHLSLNITEKYIKDGNPKQSNKSHEFDVVKDVWTEVAYPIALLHEGATATLTFSSDNNCNIDDVVLVTPPTITLSESADNSGTITANSGEIVDMEAVRTLTGGIWNTLCLPFAVDYDVIYSAVGVSSEVKMTTYNSCSSGKMAFASVSGSTVIAAGTPFLLKIPTTCINPIFRAVTITAMEPQAVTKGGVTFQGIFSPTPLNTDGSDLFIGTDNYLYQPAIGTNTINGMRAYIHTTAGTRVSLAIDDETVAVQTIGAEPQQPAVVHTLQGQRTAMLRRGLYIVNGKKVIVKQ